MQIQHLPYISPIYFVFGIDLIDPLGRLFEDIVIDIVEPYFLHRMYMALMKMRSKKQKAKMRKTKRYKGGMNAQPPTNVQGDASMPEKVEEVAKNGEVVPASPAEGQSPKETVMRHLNKALDLLKQM
jgi:hypothetical protein